MLKTKEGEEMLNIIHIVISIKAETFNLVGGVRGKKEQRSY